MTLPAPALRLLSAGMVCILLTEPLLLAASPSAKPQPVKQLQGDERILHALNRLTFGPRPADIEAVRAMGLKRWFDAQLNPGGIDDSALDARLAAFPAMKLPQEALMQRYPSPLVLRVMERQGLPLPTDPVERVIYADQMAFYRMAQEKKAAKEKNDKQDADGMAEMAAPPQPATHEDALYSGLEAVKVINLPPDARMARILAMSPQELIAFRRSLTPRELAAAAQGLSPEQKEVLAALPGSARMIGGEVLQSRLLRDIYSDRQLEAVMTDFWLNHFNIYIKKNQNEPFLLPAFERDVVRPNALGNFETLLVATAKSPAMLTYLDNAQSVGPGSQAAERSARARQRNPDAKLAKARPSGLNENYARELMELHTLGVGGGYTQADVTQVAKVFTGWTIDRPYRGASYTFEPNRHEPGPKQILGTTIKSGGEEEGLKVLHLLATSPATAKFIATKLAIRFVADDPPPALVDRMAKSFLASNGDIKTVLRTLFDAPEFWSPEVYRVKMKTPLEFVVSAARATDAQVDAAMPLTQALAKLGMPLYGMQTPNGYSWLAEPWVSTGALVSRMNFALVLTGDRLQGTRTGLPQLLGDAPTGLRPVSLTNGTGTDAATATKEQRLESLLLGQPVSERTRQAVLQQGRDPSAQQQAAKSFALKADDPDQMANAFPGGGRVDPPLDPTLRPARDEDKEAATMAGLLLGSPEFQRR